MTKILPTHVKVRGLGSLKTQSSHQSGTHHTNSLNNVLGSLDSQQFFKTKPYHRLDYKPTFPLFLF